MTYQAVMPRDIESARLIGRWQLRPDVALCAIALLGSVSAGACLMRALAWLSASTMTRPSATAMTATTTKRAPAIVVATASAPKEMVLAPLQHLRRIAKIAPPTRIAALAPARVVPAAPAALPAPASSAMLMQMPMSVAAAMPAAVGQAASVALSPIVSAQGAPMTSPMPAIVAEAAPLRPSLELETPVADAVEPDAAMSIPATSALEHEIPLPVRRPSRLAMLEAAPPSTAAMPQRVAATREAVPQTGVPQVAAPAAPTGAGHADGNSFFEKLFKPQPQQAAGPALAYAAPESQSGGLFSWLTGPKPAAISPDRLTAVYNISTHTVTLPDGTQLEAHSGYGEAKDDPASVSVRMRGVTPPNMYDLKPREALFHGVRALRMTPIGSGATYGRAGLLTHSYMLRGREGESNGCVVFRNYEAFLRAYDSGQVRRLLVVSRAS